MNYSLILGGLGGAMGLLVPSHPAVGLSLAIAGFLQGSRMGEEKFGDKIVYKNLGENGSFANFYKNRGVRWTRAKRIINELKNGDIYVNNFRFTSEVLNRASFIDNMFFKKKFEDTDLKLKIEDLKKGNLIVGSMGQGKTQFLLNIISQWHKKMVLHDTKGELTSYFYNKNTDYILNFLDERGCYIDFFEENRRGLSLSLIEDFFSSYFIAVAGEKGDKFWQEMAALRFKEIFEEIKIDDSIPNNFKMYELMRRLIYYIKVEAPEKGRTEQSIATNLETNLNIFLRMAYMQKKGYKEFSFINFFKSKNSKLFLLTIEEVAKENISFITAVLSVLFRMQLSREKVGQEDYVLYVLDEYLTFFDKLKSDLKRALHTKARSSGAILLPAIQFLPKDEEDKKNLLGSVEHFFIFGLTDSMTIEDLQKTIGKNIMLNKNKSEKQNKDDINRNEFFFVEDNVFKNLKPGRHITFMPKRNILYLADFKMQKIKEKTIGFKKISFSEENNFILFKKEMYENSSSLF